MKYKKIHVAIPILNEPGFISGALSSVLDQKYRDFQIYACINQPDSWWTNSEKQEICDNNSKVYNELESLHIPNLHLIDKYSPGNGWKGKMRGAGWARKVLMDHINSLSDKNELIISLDADTISSPEYFNAIVEIFNQNPQAAGLSVPYYHPLTGNPVNDRAILRYEIYLRHYALNMLRINSPYAYTALGSAIALPVWAYRAVSGITPVYSGEDFYFLMKLVKFGKIMHWLGEKVFPSSRPSDRVGFGTGPAIIKGMTGNWGTYPFYPYRLFDDIQSTYNNFGKLYKADISTPMDIFLKNVFNEENIWEPLRTNYNDIDNFKRACTAKVDGLRILQYLKSNHKIMGTDDEENFTDFMKMYFGENSLQKLTGNNTIFNFAETEISLLDNVRNFLETEEMKVRKNHGPLFLNKYL